MRDYARLNAFLILTNMEIMIEIWRINIDGSSIDFCA